MALRRSFLLLVASCLLSVTHGAESFYRASQSYTSTRDPDLPKYARHAEQTGFDLLKNAAWLDLGLDYRFRYEYRDDDIRRPVAGPDEPLLHRTRAYLGIHDLLDPFRFAVEMQDSRRSNSRFPPDNRDVNEFELIRLYGELRFDRLLPVDPGGNLRPAFLRYGILNFDFLDRRLISNNPWRNTANTFLGFQAGLGQDANDWQLDLLAVQPLSRSLHEWDRPVEQQWMYAAIGHWRRWSRIITLEPYYLALHQSAHGGVVERMVHNPGLRGYGVMGASGFDYDASFNYQFGQNGPRRVKAWAGTVEVGYHLDLPWEPRLSLFYGQATGDRDPADGTDNRFERFFGFSRPWSSNDYIVFENIRSPRLRLEATPSKSFRFDLGYGWFWLDSATDRFASANNVRDATGASGRFLGQEFDLRGIFTLGDKTQLTLGYTHFTDGGFVENRIRPGDSDFAYIEFSRRFF